MQRDSGNDVTGHSDPAFSHPSLTIRTTPHAGRAVFATAPIPAGTHLLTSSDLAIHTLGREYRREVCTWCFAYNRGRAWKDRDTTTGTGAVWCSVECESAWRDEYGHEDVLDAMAAVERLMSKARGHRGQDVDVVMLDAAGGQPREDVIANAWEKAEASGAAIVEARTSDSASKAAKNALQNALSEPPAPGLLTYSLSTVLIARLHPELWEATLALAPSSRPYSSNAVLAQHITSYHQLLALLPKPLLPYCTPDTLLTAANRDMANSFGLRSLDDNGAEMFGYGVWPSASYWNHSCEPNVRKQRVGRAWEFHAQRDAREGEQLCITYLGGDEDVLGVRERRNRLEKTWGFACQCGKCWVSGDD